MRGKLVLLRDLLQPRVPSPVKLAPQMDSLSRDIENISMSPEFNRSAAKLAKAGDRLDNPSAPLDEKSRLAAKLDTRFQDTKDTQETSNARSSSLSGLDRSLSRPPSRPSKAVNDLDGLGLDATAASLLSRQIEIQQQLDAIRASPPPTSFYRKQDESHRQYDKSQPSATQEANPLATEAANEHEVISNRPPLVGDQNEAQGRFARMEFQAAQLGGASPDYSDSEKSIYMDDNFNNTNGGKRRDTIVVEREPPPAAKAATDWYSRQDREGMGFGMGETDPMDILNFLVNWQDCEPEFHKRHKSMPSSPSDALQVLKKDNGQWCH